MWKKVAPLQQEQPDGAAALFSSGKILSYSYVQEKYSSASVLLLNRQKKFKNKLSEYLNKKKYNLATNFAVQYVQHAPVLFIVKLKMNTKQYT